MMTGDGSAGGAVTPDGGVRVLAAGLRRAVSFGYVGARAMERVVHAVALRMERYETAQRGDVRVRLMCREDGQPALKSFLTHRIQYVIDSDTGEVGEDVDGWLTDLVLSVGGTPPQAWPAERIRRRDYGIEFGRDRLAVGWAFGVDEAFCPALDIITEQVRYHEAGVGRWDSFRSQGHPPAYAFSAGSLLHAPPVPNGPWGEQRRRLTHSVQVVEAEPCAPVGRGVTAGRVVYDLWTYRGAESVKARHECTQAAFVALLRDGVDATAG